MKITIPTLILLLYSTLLPVHAGQGEYNVYLTAKADEGVPLSKPSTTFACRDKIYGVVEINRQNGATKHILHATWRNPSGEDQEVTQYPFQIINGKARIWVWLKLHRSAESSLVQFMNPSGGLEEFAGEWELSVRIDDQAIGKKVFELLC